MRQLRYFLLAVILGISEAALCEACAQPTLTFLVPFDGATGAAVESALIQGSDGNLYGTAMEGGSYTNYGTVFRITPDGIFTNLLSFDGTNGAFPQDGLMQDTEGNLCGTTYRGGQYDFGTVFKISTNGAFASVSFDVANASPNALLIQDDSGSYYGTTLYGGLQGLGSVFQMTKSGAVTALATFNGTNGSYPYDSGLVLGADGSFYGVCPSGGIGFDPSSIYSGYGTIFKMSTNGLITTLAFFNGTNGAFPAGALARGPDGSFYGTTCFGGIDFNGSIYSGYGTVFKLSTNGVLTTLAFFDNLTNGAEPFAGLTLGTDGNFYGTTQQGGTNFPPNPNNGTIFRITPDGELNVLVSFDGTNGYPMGGLVQANNGDFYGTTSRGNTDDGGIFRLHVPGTSSPKLYASRAEGGITLNWIALKGRTYQLQSTPSLTPGNWNNVGVPILATNSVVTISGLGGVGSGLRFYRVELLP